MSQNWFDQASRYVVRSDPKGFLAWTLGIPPSAFEFRRWIDTRNVPFPGHEDRTGDAAAHVANVLQGGTPWALAIEIQIEPDPNMFGRMMAYLASLWLTQRPDSNRGSRFELGAIIVNLTGTGDASRTSDWPDAKMSTILRAREWNLELESAASILQAIDAGQIARSQLPWIPLMQGADQLGIVEQWKQIAERESDLTIRESWAGLAQVMAEAANRKELWVQSLKGWSMRESSVVQQWIDVGRLELLEEMLQDKFGPLSPEALAKLHRLSNEGLRTLSRQILRAESLAELGLSPSQDG